MPNKNDDIPINKDENHREIKSDKTDIESEIDDKTDSEESTIPSVAFSLEGRKAALHPKIKDLITENKRLSLLSEKDFVHVFHYLEYLLGKEGLVPKLSRQETYTYFEDGKQISFQLPYSVILNFGQNTTIVSSSLKAISPIFTKFF